MYDSSVPEELQAAERRLRMERVVPGALELDVLRRNIYTRAAGASARPRSAFMKSRMTITTMLVVGMLMSMSGAGLALSGPSGSGNAAAVQYQTETTNSQTVAGNGDSSTPTKPAAEPTEVKAAQQVAATEPTQDSGDSLPFTGYSAIPVLLGGLVVLAFGLMLRRRTGGSPDA